MAEHTAGGKDQTVNHGIVVESKKSACERGQLLVEVCGRVLGRIMRGRGEDGRSGRRRVSDRPIEQLPTCS